MSTRIKSAQMYLWVAIWGICGALCSGDDRTYYGACSTGSGRVCPNIGFHPDDYCRKSQPGILCPPRSCLTDCFVRKPQPSVCSPLGRVTCDDYQPKCLPTEPCQFRPDPCAAANYIRPKWYDRPLTSKTGIVRASLFPE